MKRIFLKYIALCILILVAISLINSNKTESFSNTGAKNSYYTDATINYDDVEYDIIADFLEFTQKGNYKLSFDMLAEDCKKNQFDNNVENFANILKTEYINSDVLNQTIDFEKKGVFVDANGINIITFEINVIPLDIKKNDIKYNKLYLKNTFYIELIQNNYFSYELNFVVKEY